MNFDNIDRSAVLPRRARSFWIVVSAWAGVYLVRWLSGCAIWGLLVALGSTFSERSHPDAETLGESPTWFLVIVFGLPIVAAAAIAFLPLWRKRESTVRGNRETIPTMRILLATAVVFQIFTVVAGSVGIGVVNYVLVGTSVFLTTLALDESRPRQFLWLLIAASQAHLLLLASLALGVGLSAMSDKSLGMMASLSAVPVVVLLGWMFWRCGRRSEGEGREVASPQIRDEESPDFEPRSKQTELAIGLGAGALLFSLIPIVSIPAAVGALVLGIPRLNDPKTKTTSIVAILLAAVSIPVAIVSAISGATQANAYYEREEGKATIERVHLEMSQHMGQEIQSGKHMRQMVQRFATIDVSECPEDYQQVYGEMIVVMTDLAFYAARNDNLGQNILIFIESLIESFGGDMSGLEDTRLADGQLMRRVDQMENKLRLVCAKYGVVADEPSQTGRES